MSRSAPFLGMRSTEDFESSERPQNYREMILWEYPQGASPITALSSQMKSESVDDPTYHWYSEKLPEQGGTIADVYTDAALSSAVTSDTTAAGTMLYVKMYDSTTSGLANVREFGVGKTVTLAVADVPQTAKLALVKEVVPNGTSSYIKVQLLQTDSATVKNSTNYSIADADLCFVAGSAFGEGTMPPDAIHYVPTKYSNYTQIFKTTIDLSNTALQTRYRTGDAKALERKRTLRLHGVEMEMAALMGEAYETVDGDNKPLRFTGGLYEFIKTNAPSNVFDYRYDTGFSGQTWEEGGEKFLNQVFEQCYRTGGGNEDDTRLVYSDNSALLGVENLARAYSNIQMTGQDLVYGMKVNAFKNSFGTQMFRTHPLMNQKALFDNTMIVTYPSYNIFRPFKGRDTTRKDVTPAGYDGVKEQWLTEGGWEFHYPDVMAIVHGVGKDNVL